MLFELRSNRDRNNRLLNRNILLKHDSDIVLATIMIELNSSMSGYPHSLLEISNKQWLRIKSYSIHVSDMVVSQLSSNIKSVTYNNIEVGDKIILRTRKGNSNGSHQQWNTPLLGNMVNSVLAIVTSKQELLQSNPKLISTDGCKSYKSQGINSSKDEDKASGIVILMLSSLIYYLN